MRYILYRLTALPGGIPDRLTVLTGHILSLYSRLTGLWSRYFPGCGFTVLPCYFRTFPAKALFVCPVDLFSEGICRIAWDGELPGIVEILIVS